ncbi:MAG: hypothetical protein AB2693_12715 [Candidatus Thiodiazotropha sp.]
MPALFAKAHLSQYIEFFTVDMSEIDAETKRPFTYPSQPHTSGKTTCRSIRKKASDAAEPFNIFVKTEAKRREGSCHHQFLNF